MPLITDELKQWALMLAELVYHTPLHLVLGAVVLTLLSSFAFLYFALVTVAPIPRSPFKSEKQYITTSPDGSVAKPKPLPCWHDEWLAHRHMAKDGKEVAHTGAIQDAEIEMSVVVPAFNEEERIEIMLEEAVGFLDEEFGRLPKKPNGKVNWNGSGNGNGNAVPGRGLGGYEILIVNDGSKDKTVDVALEFCRKKGLHDVLRVCTLKENRGKGGAVTHGFRHVRGQYTVFADADGASKFEDLKKLVEGCRGVEDEGGRGVAVGSRNHLVRSEAVVKRSALRNLLMYGFHFLLRLLTPPATSRIRDTQCGFKLFSRASLPHIVPYMHAEGWIFDVEMLMLAESSPDGGIGVEEVQIGWKEVGGSKLNVMWDSLGMAWSLAVLRASWIVGVYKRR